jgi:antitoxin (DNA-binding transcriptional repressor) of toxin-antitoxin stability system
MTENPLGFGADAGDHQVITRAGRVEAVVVPVEECRALQALEQREAELSWAGHEARYPSRPGDDEPEGKACDSMDARLAGQPPGNGRR